MTFSVVGRCAKTGMFGLAVSSSSPAVAARCAHARAAVGAVASQNITDPTLGPQALDLMALGASALEALEALKRTAPHLQYRQLTLIDGDGRTARFSGTQTLGTHATAEGRDVVVAGNLLSSTTVPTAMVAAFEAADGLLGDRLLAALQAGLDAGGEAGSVHSAGMVIVDRVSWPMTDLRVDWRDDDPIGELARLWELWKPQAEAYITRALDPTEAPSFGVAGDE